MEIVQSIWGPNVNFSRGGTRLVRCRDVAGMKKTLRRTVGWLKSGESGKFLILAHGETRFPGRKLDFNLVTKKFHDWVKEAYNVNMYAKKGDH